MKSMFMYRLHAINILIIVLFFNAPLPSTVTYEDCPASQEEWLEKEVPNYKTAKELQICTEDLSELFYKLSVRGGNIDPETGFTEEEMSYILSETYEKLHNYYKENNKGKRRAKIKGYQKKLENNIDRRIRPHGLQIMKPDSIN